LWYYNKAEDTPAKMKAIQALQYMMTNQLWEQEQQMAMQPKVDQSLRSMATEEQQLNVNWLWTI
jgi:hypothetical protein